MARGHARRGHEEAGELIDVVALRQSVRGQMLKMIAEQMIHGCRQQPEAAIDRALGGEADEIDRIGIVVAVFLKSALVPQRSPFAAHDVNLVPKSKEVFEDCRIGLSFNANKRFDHHPCTEVRPCFANL